MKSRRFSAFTLIETLMYVAFAGMILTSVVWLAATALTIRSKTRASIVLEEDVRFASGRIRSLVTASTGILAPTASATGTTLQLSMASSSANPTTISFATGTIYLTQGTGTAMALTSSEVLISRLVFTRVSSTAASIRMVLTGGLRNAPTMTVTTTASVPR